MATARDIVSGALKLLGIRAAESPITDIEADDGLEALNDMMAEWVADNICTNYEPVDDVNEDLCVDEEALGAIKANLAIYIAPEYNRVVSRELEMRAKRGKRLLRPKVGKSQFPDSLPVGSGNQDNAHRASGDRPGVGWDDIFYPANTEKCS